jgi:hypothetical protein
MVAIIPKDNCVLPKCSISQPINALALLQLGRLNMSEKIETQMISRRAAFRILALAVVPATVLTALGAEAQTSGTERRQDRRQDRTERRQERRTSRTERREVRREGRSERRDTRRTGTTGSGTSGTTGSGSTGQPPREY